MVLLMGGVTGVTYFKDSSLFLSTDKKIIAFFSREGEQSHLRNPSPYLTIELKEKAGKSCVQ